MPLVALRQTPQRKQIAQSFSLPAPTGGLNAHDELFDMDERDALVLENFYPEPNSVVLRKGYSSHATGIGAAVESLMEWAGPSSRKLFAAKSTAIYEATSSGAVGAAAVSSLNSGKWQHTMFKTSAGSFLVLANGSDAVRNYDGTNWTSPSITGATSADLINVIAHKKRLWFVEKNSTKGWYLGTEAISGAATAFDFGAVFPRGGKLVAFASWSKDSGSGPDDFFAAISSLGDVAVYAGTDPSSANTWAHIGTFRTGAPIGNRPVMQVGGDAALITRDGVVTVGAVAESERASSKTVTDKIRDLFTKAASSYAGNFGWQGILYARRNMAIFNVPTTEGATQVQYVANMLTGAWAKWTGLNASCWVVFNEDLYFGGNSGTVWKADQGFQDNGSGITADLKTAFNYLKSKGRQKRFTMLRPVFLSNGRPGFLCNLNIDFADQVPTDTVSVAPASASVWGTGKWGSAKWSGGAQVVKEWTGAAGVGTCAAIRLRVTSNGHSFTLNSFDIVAEPGGVV